MYLNFLSLIPLLLVLIGYTNADDILGKVETTATGCDLSGISSTAGFNAKFYPYSISDTVDYSQTSFYAGGYSSGGVITTASDVTSPDFKYQSAATFVAQSELYGALIDITNFTMPNAKI